MPKSSLLNLVNKAKAHALFSPSGMLRWRKEHCPGSIKFCSSVPELPPNPAAAEGTRGHTHLELILADLYLGRPFLTRALPPVKTTTRVAVDTALHVIAQLVMRGCRVIDVELKVHASNDVWGTLDVLLYDPVNTLLMVLDYKNGTRPVYVEDNPQLLCYAWGAWQQYRTEYPVQRVCMGIIQPNSDSILKFRTDIKYVSELFDFSLYMHECVTVAKAPDAPLKAGDWCYWCQAAPRCPVRDEYQQTLQAQAALDNTIRQNINQIVSKHGNRNRNKL